MSAFWTAENGEGDSAVTVDMIPIKIITRPLTINVLKDGKAVGDSSLVTMTMNASASLENLLIQVNGGDGRWKHCNEIVPAVAGLHEDLCSVTLDLSLFAGHGFISNSSEPFSRNREQDSTLASVRFVGSVVEANRFLQQQVYVPDSKFYGPDQVVINIKHTTSATHDGAMVEDTVLLPVFVSPACEAPHLIWADSGTNLMSLSCSTTAPFKLPEILIAREGLDKGYCQDDKVFHVIVEADQGSLTSNSTAAISSSGDLRAVVVLEGRIWDLNLALKSVEYQFEIHREAQIPVTASVGVRVLGETSHENNLTDLLSSALLQLKLAGDIWLSDMLARETIVGFEDTDMLISDEIILDWFAHLAEDDTIIISVQSGAVYAAADLVHMEASDEHRINAGDVRYLRSVMSNLRYIPSSNFNGIDEIHFKTQNQESTLYIYIQAENDPPEFKFNAEELKDWYKYPRKFIPTFQIKDPDDNHVFQVDIRADNGSLSLDQISSLSFDGVTVELSSSSSSLRMTSSLSRTLELTMTFSSGSGAETIHFQLTPTFHMILQSSQNRPDNPNSNTAADVGESWSIPGIYIGDGSGQLVVDDDDLDLEIEAGIEPFFRTMWDEMQHAEDHDDAFTPADTVVDKVDRWNAALETLQCTCSGVCDHQDTTVIQVRNLLAPLPVSSHQQTIRIDTLYDVPIPRVTSGASLYYSTEDSAFQFPDLALQFTKSKAIDSAQDDQWSSTELSYRPTKYANPRNDEDNRRIYQLEIRVSYGSIFMIGTDRLSVMSRLKMEGNVTNLERDLKRLVYSPPQNWNEEQFPGGHIVEWQFVVSYQNKSVESFTDLVIMSRVDAPVISVPHALEDPLHYMNDYLSVLRVECLPLVCDEDTPMALDGFSVRSADSTKQQKATADLLVISLSVSHGVISLGDTWRTNCISRFVGAQSWKRKSFKANVDCVNRVLTGTEYIGEPNFSGTDQLKIRVEFAVEPGGAFEEITVPIIVIELNDAPYIAVDSVFYEADEDIPLVINDLLLRDPDALDELLSVIMETNYGQLALLRPNGVKLTTERVENAGKNGSRLTLEGTLRNIDAAVASVVYTSAKDWNSLQFRPDDGMNGFDTITITSTDLSSFNGSSVSVLFVYVDPKPDPVLIDASSNGLTSIYADDERGTLRGDEDTWIIARVTHGLLSLSCGRGLTFLEGSTDGGRALEFKGTFTNVNACMIALRYLPNKDFYGQDSLVVTATAVDEYTQQQTPSSSILVSIMVDAVNDAPVWNVGSSIVREIQQDQAASIAGVSFHDVDVAATDCTAEACVMDLIIEASSGVVTLPDQSPPLFSNDMATKKVAYTVLSGTPDELNMLISDMTFMLAGSEYYRADSPSRTDIKLQLTVDDRGVFGSGGPQISTTTIIFSPVMWSRYKFSLLVPEAVLTLNEDTAFGFGGDLQLIDPDSAGSFRNIFEFSINCTNGVFALSSRVAGVQVLRNDSDSGVIIRGFFAQLNAALNGSSYIPAANWYGSEEISLSVVELNHLEKTRETVETSIFLFVAPVCDEPQWATLTDTPLTMKEDEYLLVDKLSLTDPDLDGGQHEVEVTIGVAHGGVMLSMTQGLLIEQAAYSTSEDRLVAQHVAPGHSFSGSRHFFSDLVVRGRVSDINAAFKGMVFKPWLDYNSDGWPVDEIVFAATSFCGNSKTTASHITIPIAVFAVNDPPVLISQYFQPLESSYSVGNLEAASWSSSIEASEHSPQQLESTELYDPDDSLGSGDLRLLVNVSCIHCSITSEYLSHPSETQPSDDLIVVPRKGKSDESVQLIIHGTLVSLNSGLMSQLIFQGADNFNGLAFVLVEISDLGNYGEGGTLRSVFVLCVKVKPVNDISQANLPQYQSQTNIVGQVEIRDNEPPTISIASTFYAPAGEWVALAGIEITDPDSVEGILYVSLAVHNGKLRVTLSPRVNSVGPTALHSTVDGAIAQKLEFATTAEQANEIFQTLEYRCDDDNGCSKSLRDYLRVHVDDNGFTGAGGSQVATKRAEIVVA
ncbi:hypothetical protein PC122_g9599 [Phytophthora cactorum]|nr:hypothetical protein PC122_g9599 [Phytophthora cactorum]